MPPLPPRFSNSFDTVLGEAQDPEITSLLLRLIILLHGPIVLSDTQAIDSLAMRKLFKHELKRILLRQRRKDQLPIIVLTRDAGGFDRVLKDMIDVEGKHEEVMNFSSIGRAKQARIEEEYRNGKLDCIERFYEIADEGSEYPLSEHISTLNSIYSKRQGTSLFQWKPLQHSYPDEILRIVNLLKDELRDEEARSIMNTIKMEIESPSSGGKPTRRTRFYKIVEECNASPEPKEKVKRLILDVAYNANFSNSNDLAPVTHAETANEMIVHELPKFKEVFKPKRLDIVNLRPLLASVEQPLSHERISFGFLSQIFGDEEYRENIMDIHTEDNPKEGAESIHGHMKYIVKRLKGYWKGEVETKLAPLKITYSKPIPAIEKASTGVAIAGGWLTLYAPSFLPLAGEICILVGHTAIFVVSLLGKAFDKFIYHRYKWRQFANTLSQTYLHSGDE